MKKVTGFLIALTVTFAANTSTTLACPSECDTEDQACMNALMMCVEQANTDATLNLIGALAVVGGGIWWWTTRDSSSPEEKALLLQEASLGQGFRITDADSPYRVALFPVKDPLDLPSLEINHDESLDPSGNDFNGGIGLISAEIKFD